jgi:hypothetical protein
MQQKHLNKRRTKTETGKRQKFPIMQEKHDRWKIHKMPRKQRAVFKVNAVHLLASSDNAIILVIGSLYFEY